MSWVLIKLLDQPETFKLEPPLWIQRASRQTEQALTVLYSMLDTIAWLCMGWVVYIACSSLQLDIGALIFILLLVLIIKIIR